MNIYYPPDLVKTFNKIQDSSVKNLRNKISQDLSKESTVQKILDILYLLEFKIKSRDLNEVLNKALRDLSDSLEDCGMIEKHVECNLDALLNSTLSWIRDNIEYYERKGAKLEWTQAKDNIKKLTKSTLLDYWVGEEKSYKKCLEYLQKSFKENDGQPFLQYMDKKYIWNKYPPKGWLQYLKAFLQKCYSEKLILNKEISGRDWVKIIENTFNVKPGSPLNFTHLPISDVNPKYSSPFNSLKSSIIN